MQVARLLTGAEVRLADLIEETVEGEVSLRRYFALLVEALYENGALTDDDMVTLDVYFQRES